MKPLTRRQKRLLALVGLGTVPPAIALVGLNYTITATTQPAIQAAIAGGIITGVGTIATAIYKEISAYFDQTTTNVDNKVKMVSPLVQSYYNPWIHSAEVLGNHMKTLATRKGNFLPGDIESLLYYLLIYYGYRMKFILEAGGIILLSTSQEQDAVNKAYGDVEKALDWEKDTTHLDVSYLQGLFLSPETLSKTAVSQQAAPADPAAPGKSNPGSGSGGDSGKPSGGSTAEPYLYYQFYNDVQLAMGKQAATPSLADMMKSLAPWAGDPKNMTAGSEALERFSSTFKQSIDKLYTAWGE